MHDPIASSGVLANESVVNPLKDEKSGFKDITLRDLFEQDRNRFNQFSTHVGDILFDYSKNHLKASTLERLCELAEAANLTQAIEALFNGEPVNFTEGRAAHHTALRTPHTAIDETKGKLINDCHQQMKQFVSAIESGEWTGYSGEAIKTVINIGIGGSDLGPAMAVNALRHTRPTSPLSFHFVSNIDPSQLLDALEQSDPATTLFIVASKTFTTMETLQNAMQAKQWLLRAAGEPAVIQQHFVAVTANIAKAEDFGINNANVFPMWDWVGGRYSIWSSIGLPLMLAIGEEGFEEFLHGGHLIDNHFRSAPLEKNVPVLMGLISIWYSHFFGTASHAVIPYEHYLQLFPNYLQQLDMESNGKSCARNGIKTPWNTGVPIWGGAGSNTQHSFHQLFHQGTTTVPLDFIVGTKSPNPLGNQHDYLYANCLAQSRALMQGKNYNECMEELLKSGMSESEAVALAPHKVIEGNKPSNTLVYPLLTPSVLGQLIALYEHKVFVQSIIWNINAFDQWGVELGKRISQDIFNVIKGSKSNLDSSTEGLIKLKKG